MKKSDFYYDLPPELIAQTPIASRDASRLMVLGRRSGEICHSHFYDVLEYLSPGDCLVLNDTKVLPARLYGIREGTGARVEFLLLNREQGAIHSSQFTIHNDAERAVWECIAGPGKKALPGDRFCFKEGLLFGEVLGTLPNGNRRVAFEYGGDFYEVLDAVGEMPLPHYISEKLDDTGRYQTVYARELGSAAAPTAGLHFTPELLEKIAAKGVYIEYVTLHVGVGTFRPVRTENIEDHVMHSEYYTVSNNTALKINETKKSGGKIIAVGTTSCRTLEAAADDNGCVAAGEARTDIFIYPGYRFKCIDALITNFHLPESSLIMLVSAFYGTDNTKKAYRCAVEERYRFYSFGDAMLIV